MLLGTIRLQMLQHNLPGGLHLFRNLELMLGFELSNIPAAEKLLRVPYVEPR